MTYRRKLIEVALPLQDINREAARVKVKGSVPGIDNHLRTDGATCIGRAEKGETAKLTIPRTDPFTTPSRDRFTDFLRKTGGFSQTMIQATKKITGGRRLDWVFLLPPRARESRRPPPARPAAGLGCPALNLSRSPFLDCLRLGDHVG
jgi:hypothetical protein